MSGVEAAIGRLSIEEQQTALSPSSHSCRATCKCSEAKCKICYDLNWKLFEEPPDPIFPDRPPLPVLEFIKTKPELLEYSSKLGCQTCEILWQGIDGFFQENFNAEGGVVEYMRDKEVVMELSTGNSVIVMVEVVVHIALPSKVAIEFFTTEGRRQSFIVRNMKTPPIFLRHTPHSVYPEFLFGTNQELTATESNSWSHSFRIAKSLSRELDLEHIKDFIEDTIPSCNHQGDNHSFCEPCGGTALPTRVIDVGEQSSPQVRLFITNSKVDKYMTLSHSWGKNPENIPVTLKSNIEERKMGFNLDTLTQTFRDAILLTRALGIKYLWIDSLCILQDKDDMSDWSIEAPHMADVYSNSYLNISAVNHSGRIFGKRVTAEERLWWLRDVAHASKEIVLGTEKKSTGVFVRRRNWTAHQHFGDLTANNKKARSSPLLTRAWVLQERLLAPRTIHVHCEELIWECASGITCECGEVQCESTRPNPFASIFNALQNAPDPKVGWRFRRQFAELCYNLSYNGNMSTEDGDCWLSIVTAYTGLRLTNETDRLTALSGLASKVSKLMESPYLAGIWQCDLLRGLLWRRQPSDLMSTTRNYTLVDSVDFHIDPEQLGKFFDGGKELEGLNIQREPGSRFPTWSWASLQWFHPESSGFTGIFPNEGDRFSWADYTHVQGDSFKADDRIGLEFAVCFDSQWKLHTLTGVKRGMLRFEAAFVKAELVTLDDRGRLLKNPYLKRLENMEDSPNTRMEIFLDETGQLAKCSGITVWCILLGYREWAYLRYRSAGNEDLTLILVDTPENGPGIYKRVGVAGIESNAKWFVNVEVQRFDII